TPGIRRAPRYRNVRVLGEKEGLEATGFGRARQLAHVDAVICREISDAHTHLDGSSPGLAHGRNGNYCRSMLAPVKTRGRYYSVGRNCPGAEFTGHRVAARAGNVEFYSTGLSRDAKDIRRYLVSEPQETRFRQNRRTDQ